MKLEFIPLDKLSVSPANMRHARRAPDVSDLLPTLRARGILQPLIVRAAGEGDGYEVLAGARRLTAARLVHDERLAAGEPSGDDVPCAIIDPGDDAAAIEASLIENLARLDPDEVTQWETFARLVREGRKPDEIAVTFGLPELAVRRILALGNLLRRVRTLYRREEIDAATVRHLTLASRERQRAWLARLDNPADRAPRGAQLKAWLFGGAAIPTSVALFDVGRYDGVVVGDLFGEERFFADADAFWAAQNAAVEARRAAYLDAGWSEVVVVGPAATFHYWEHERCPKRKGGRVYLVVSPRGEVTVHEGYVTRAEARRRERGEAPAATRPARAEVTSALQTYLDLHRHAAVRAALAGAPQVALRLMVAHLVAGSPLWSVRVEPQASRDETVRASVAASAAEAAFAERRRAVLALLGFDLDAPSVVRGNGDAYGLVGVFLRLIDLPDRAVLEVAAVAMGETLAAGSAAVEAVGVQLGVEMARCWKPDAAFFDLLRDKEVLGCIVAEVAGEAVAAANAGEKAKALKTVVADHLAGSNGRAKVEAWVPRWMAFPPSAYTARGGVGSVRAHALVEAARQPEGNPLPDPDAGSLADPHAGSLADPDAPDGVAAEPDRLAA